jgi:hypothetical protein
VVVLLLVMLQPTAWLVAHLVLMMLLMVLRMMMVLLMLMVLLMRPVQPTVRAVAW